ncbi:hypothetical protein CMI41_04905 [Candidatus Pacearchaeota archaeon]|nr:hypothetical protein [Candidatus Pacearchaeota archaeon]
MLRMENNLAIRKIEGERRLIFRFPYDPSLVDVMRKLEGRRWHSSPKFWTANICISNLNRVKKYFPFINEVEEEYNILSCSNFDKSLLEGLYPFQKQGVRWLQSRNGRGLLADEMGNGKSIQTIGYLKINPDIRPALIVCPASLKLNWQREIKKWMNDDAEVVNGSSGKLDQGITIINYDILYRYIDRLRGKISVLVLDEVHKIKSNKTRTTKSAMKLGKTVDRIIALSGTPIINRPVEFFNTLNLISPAQFPSYWKYAMRYCDAHKDYWGWKFDGASNIGELREKINPLMLRRLKKDVLQDLPDKTVSILPFQINKVNYNRKEAELTAWIKESKLSDKGAKINALAKLEALKQVAVSAKLDSVQEWVNNFLTENGKLVLFTTHHFTVDWVMQNFKQFNPVKLDGRDSITQKQKAVDTFQNDSKCRLFVGNIKAAGVGITLSAASTCCFLELGWSPGEHAQAMDRLHRIGQKNSVNVYYMIAEGTIEEQIANLLDEKMKVLDAILDGKETDESSLLMNLLEDYKNNSGN